MKSADVRPAGHMEHIWTMRRALQLLAGLALVWALASGCAQSAGSAGAAGQTGGVTAGAPKDRGALNMIFPDFPVPRQLEVMTDESFILSLPQFRGGIIVLKGSIPPESVQNFFLAELPKRGWQFVSSLASKASFLAFKKDAGGQCLIKYQGLPFKRSKVEIWLAEPLEQRGPAEAGL